MELLALKSQLVAETGGGAGAAAAGGAAVAAPKGAVAGKAGGAKAGGTKGAGGKGEAQAGGKVEAVAEVELSDDEFFAQRLAKAGALLAAGTNPYAYSFAQTHSAATFAQARLLVLQNCDWTLTGNNKNNHKQQQPARPPPSPTTKTPNPTPPKPQNKPARNPGLRVAARGRD